MKIKVKGKIQTFLNVDGHRNYFRDHLKNQVSFEIKRRIVLANRCYFGLAKQLDNRANFRKSKVTLYNTLILSVLLYGAEAWVLMKADDALLGVFEKIYGPIRFDGAFRHRMNSELHSDIAVVRRLKIQRMHWLGHGARM